MGELGRLIESHKDRAATRDPYARRPTNAEIARAVGVTRSTVGHWIAGKMPRPEHIAPLARITGESYARVLSAALADAGYLLRERDLDGHQPAAMTRAGGSPAPDRVADVVEAALVRYFARVDRVLDERARNEHGAMLDELRTELRRDIAERLAVERPDTTENVG